MMHESTALGFERLGAPGGELAIVHARERAEKALGPNGADGISDIEGKVARAAASKLGNQRVSMELTGSAT